MSGDHNYISWTLLKGKTVNAKTMTSCRPVLARFSRCVEAAAAVTRSSCTYHTACPVAPALPPAVTSQQSHRNNRHTASTDWGRHPPLTSQLLLRSHNLVARRVWCLNRLMTSRHFPRSTARRMQRYKKRTWQFVPWRAQPMNRFSSLEQHVSRLTTLTKVTLQCCRVLKPI